MTFRELKDKYYDLEDWLDKRLVGFAKFVWWIADSPVTIPLVALVCIFFIWVTFF